MSDMPKDIQEHLEHGKLKLKSYMGEKCISFYEDGFWEGHLITLKDVAPLIEALKFYDDCTTENLCNDGNSYREDDGAKAWMALDAFLKKYPEMEKMI